MLRRTIIVGIGVLALTGGRSSHAGETTYAFYVLNQRTIGLTAEYWNPILTYVSRKSAVPLDLKLTKTAREGIANAEAGRYDFIYTNHFFTPERDRLHYHVIARPAGLGLRSQIVVPVDSRIRSLRDLEGKPVAFVTPDAFAGYWLPMDALLRASVNVKVSFTGNQEASATQLRVNKVAAAAVNATVMARYGRRESFEYRALWTSDLYGDLCIMANPNLPTDKVRAVQAALIGMAQDAQGLNVLKAGADLLKIDGELGFVAADDRDYENYRRFFKTTRVRPVE